MIEITKEEREEQIQNFKKKSQFFLENKTKIFIRTLSDMYYFGFINRITNDFVIVLDKFNVLVPILFSEIRKLEVFVENKKERENEK